MRGLEFRTASTSTRIVHQMKASTFRLFSSDRTSLASLSAQKIHPTMAPSPGWTAVLSPCWTGVLVRLPVQLTKVFSEAWKVFALSETISFGRPQHPVNLLRQSKNIGASRLETSSKCTARLVAQVNRAIYTFVALSHPSRLILQTKDQRSPLLHSWKRAHPWLEILVNRAILELDSSGLEIFDIYYIQTVPSSQFVSPLGSST